MKLFTIFKGRHAPPHNATEPVVKPAVERPRHRCPFYRFSPLLDIMRDQRVGNQCAILSDRGEHGMFSPCKMEVDGETPDWEHCFLAGECRQDTVALRIGERVTVFPEEFPPEGVPFADWYRYVMDGATQRPPPRPDG